MHAWIRNTHLWVSLFFLLMVLVYGVSSVQMAHPGWFGAKPAVSETTVRLDPAAATDARAAAQALGEERDLRGDLQQVEETPEGIDFRIVRPGTVHEVHYSRATGVAKIRTSVAGFMGMLNRIHHVGGLHHDYALINLWGALVGLVSLALVLLGATGIYLWFRTHRERVPGAILLALSLGFSLSLIVLIRVA